MATKNLRDVICNQVARILCEERKKRLISMTVLAQRAGLSQSMISLVERDLRNSTLETLLRICEVLEIDLAEILRKATAAASKTRRS